MPGITGETFASFRKPVIPISTFAVKAVSNETIFFCKTADDTVFRSCKAATAAAATATATATAAATATTTAITATATIVAAAVVTNRSTVL